MRFRPADPDRDFATLALWLTETDGEENTADGLREYSKKNAYRIRNLVVEDDEGSTHAYNLHTGVDRNYRGRGLGRAVKTKALQFVVLSLGVTEVRTVHNELNAPMLAIDRRPG